MATVIDGTTGSSIAGATTLPTIKSSTFATPPTIQDSAGTQIGTFCRAWVNFNGATNVGGFCTIRGSFNVSSVADNGTGDYTVNFTTAMPDVNYAAIGGFDNTNILAGGNIGGYTTTSVNIQNSNSSNVATDGPVMALVIFR